MSLPSEILQFKSHQDSRGSLVAIESLKNVPIPIQRVYYLWGLHDEPRGFHAHKKIRQVMVCLQGSLELHFDDGMGNKRIFHLSNPSEGILIDALIWHEMHNFSRDCIVMVLASHHHDESDYIRNYDEFIREVEKGHQNNGS